MERIPKLVSRRSFLARASLSFAALCAATISACTSRGRTRGSFGGPITIHERPEDIIASIRAQKQPFYSPKGRFYLIAYEPSDRMRVYERQGVAASGLMAIYQRCTHLGCRVPFCKTSQLFECPCHISNFNKHGEYLNGVASRGLDRFPIAVTRSLVAVDTGRIIAGPARDTFTTDERAAGPLCTDGGLGSTP